ncbi:cytochrome P450 [Dactylosporangium sp. NPDC005572]|uniref:cytochrome P450 n=1 Tax=Dactylosporangium sp. NPDC005572 TaxID=3156889 RepID=UPI0033B42D55
MTATLAQRDEEITAFFAADPATIAWPYPMYERWQRGTGIVRWSGGPATVLTRHRDVKAVMGGAYPLSNNGYRHGTLPDGIISRLPLAHHEIFFKIMDFEALFMSRTDGETHARLRRISSRAFTARRIAELRDAIQAHVDDLVADMLAHDDPDLKTELADQLPVRVICDLIGVPQHDREMIKDWSTAIAAFMSVDEGSLRRADAALDAFIGYLTAMIDRVRTTGEGPELARLLLDGRDSEAMTEDELIATYLVLLFGGSETTTNLLGNGFLALQRHREQWDMLVADPGLVRGAIDELMRYDSPHHYLPRLATADFEISGEPIHAGETVIVVMGAANRDPEVFDDPGRLDITRPNRAEHLSLAFGPHYCLGAALARLEGEIVFTTLVTRFPRARLRAGDIAYGGSAMLRAIQHLPTDLGVSRA